MLLTLSANDLLNPDVSKRLAHARDLRERIDELHTRLGIRLPIYVMVTKTDLLAGFVEFLADFDKDERGWLATLLEAIADAAPLLVTGDDGEFMNRCHRALNPTRPKPPRENKQQPENGPSPSRDDAGPSSDGSSPSGPRNAGSGAQEALGRAERKRGG